MKLDSAKNVGPVTGTCCRQAPVRGLVGGLIVSACFIGVAVLVWQGEFPWFVWGCCAAMAALVVPLIMADALAKFRSTNWLMRLRPDGLRINLRSYQNRHLPEAATVVHLPYGEISRAHRHVETWSTPEDRAGRRVVQWKEESLQLHLRSEERRVGKECRSRWSRYGYK